MWRITATETAVEQLPTDAAGYRGLTDAEVTDAMRRLAAIQSAVETSSVILSGEVARRSGPDRGLSGLAQVNGFGSAEKMVQEVGKTSKRDAAKRVHLGVMMDEAAGAGTVDEQTGEVCTPSEPWLAPVVEALGSGALSPDAADAIRRGLGSPTSAVTVEQLTEAARDLSLEAASLNPDEAFRRAKARRDEMDFDGVKLREDEIYAKRGIKDWALPGGGGQALFTFDTEGWAIWLERKRRMLSPKLGGVQFVDPERKAWSDRVLKDGRSPQQLFYDDVLDLMRLGETVNPDFMIGTGASQIRITATQWDLDQHEGLGRVEGVYEPVSIQTVERNRCDALTATARLDEQLHPLNLEWEKRLFNPKQKAFLALIWGGCAIAGCGKPPAYCEAHHVLFWLRDKGKTNIGNGILLCRFHHRWIHNSGYQITIDDTADGDRRFYLVPPKSVDPAQTPILLLPKSGSMRDLRIAMEKERAARERTARKHTAHERTA